MLAQVQYYQLMELQLNFGRSQVASIKYLQICITPEWNEVTNRNSSLSMEEIFRALGGKWMHMAIDYGMSHGTRRKKTLSNVLLMIVKYLESIQRLTI